MEADDILLGDPAAHLHLDKLQRPRGRVVQSMHGAHGNEKAVAGFEPALLPVAGGERFAVDDDPMLRAAIVILKRQPRTGRDRDQLDQEPGADMQNGIGTPGAQDGRRRHILSVKEHEQNEIA